jgi:Ca2+-binding EF-hand superfamily protein
MMRKKILHSALVSVFLLSSYALADDSSVGAKKAAAAVKDADGNLQRSVKVMTKFDANQDQKITFEEFIALSKDEEAKATMTGRYKKFDTNQDGAITYDELNARFTKLLNR